MKKLKAGIIGGAGYTGGELIRLLIHHPGVSVSFIHSRSHAGQPVHAVHHDLFGETDLAFSNEIGSGIDLLFLCVGHGESKKFLSENEIDEKIRIIDLANDFRLSATSKMGKRKFIYGLPEMNREEIRKAKNLANPGCFATSIQLALLPLAKAGLLNEIYTTGITGSTGAGQSHSQTSHFSWRENNIQAYKTLTHQHLGEVNESLKKLQPDVKLELNFVPWRGDFTRGIFTSSTLACAESLEFLNKLYEEFYAGDPFTRLSRETIFLKQVVNTNRALIHLEKAGTKLVIHSAIDNLLKGASGQAVQNMNLMFGLDERTGLQLKANYF
jgi:N-acetyl-gamma-glutamyl-phosphate reductase